MTIVDLLAEPFAHEFMRRALVVALVASVTCGLLSCWLVLLSWSLMGDAVAHSVLPGVVIAYAVGLPFALGALVFGLGAAGLVGVLRRRTGIRDDAAIGIVFTSLFALGLVLVSVTPSQVDLGHIVFGNLLGVRSDELWIVLGLAAPLIAILLLKRRDLTLTAFDPDHAHAIGLRPERIRALLLVLLALTVVVALQVVGVVLVVALLILPGATARILTDRFGRMLVIAPITAAAGAFVGVAAAYWLDASPGGLVVLVDAAVFALALAWARIRGGRRARRQLGETQTASVATAPRDAASADPPTRMTSAPE